MKTIQVAEVTYKQSGESTKTNELGMREMQAKAYEQRTAQYLLIKAPPASGKSRALMFIALDKLYNQDIKKVIVAVPEKSIGGSFKNTDLTSHGFFTDWSLNDNYNLCTPGTDGSKSKITTFKNFIKNDEKILICTHATLRFAADQLSDEDFNNTLVAIDEFHHVSADKENSRLGSVLHGIMTNSNAHIVAMTGSYFRGDGVAVLLPEDEQKFTKVTYNYYQQLNGYKYLKTLGIGYHFYSGKYLSAIGEVLDTDKKTILHIPNVNSGESTKDKLNEVDMILDIIGEVDHQDHDTGIIYVKRDSDGKLLKVANLVDDARDRDKIVDYLRNMSEEDDMDIIIALGMAKEGFDWPYCEHALTVGYRSSLTEIIQIIGRCTRDSANKTHAQFTNLIAQPDATDETVKISVNNMLKAITCSLLMEQVMAPHFEFKAKSTKQGNPGDILIKGFKEPSTVRVKDIIESDIHDLKASILQDDQVVRALPGNIDAEVLNKVMIPKIIKEKYPDLTEQEIEEVRQHVVVDSVIKNGEIKEVGNQKFVRMAGQFVNIEDLAIDLIDRINPFQEAYEILSKEVTTATLKVIQDIIDASRIEITPEEAALQWPKIQAFYEKNGRKPDMKSEDPLERRMAEVVIYLTQIKAKRG
ncbi:MAG: ATP-dependent helicase [Candidatus Magasanikbacteria bacterium CG11_big_fil_rev_8_21_14_0_20_39_34]|uniref:ATP-dependent helicase n=1 Tax=Candidatus Magasanikbacteria bacterium CG11_big_fil_rev_8_21_14_0_20_39_34 TaxID=1974653 RepID=A0A2H0N6Z0_9BACT|nr:MAG: ATP-dependent helicase [Candidatus Magasanikbacteria bacterium CG11_big_fil_rev_8_21_14_0_20_39_34]